MHVSHGDGRNGPVGYVVPLCIHVVGMTIGGNVAANIPPNAQDINRQYRNTILFFFSLQKKR